jgi:hypothetical protein
MAYMKNANVLISRPVESAYGTSEELGSDFWDTIKGGAGSVLDFYGSGLKAQGGQEALAAQLAAQRAEAQAKAASGGGGVSTTMLVVGGLAVAGLLVFAMRRK